MEQASARYGWLVSLVGVMMWTGILAGLFFAGAGIYLIRVSGGQWLYGTTLVMIGFFTIPMWIVIYGFMTLLINTEEDMQGVSAELTSVVSELRTLQVVMDGVGTNVMMSDAAKEVLGREKDRETLRQAILEDLARRDWESANHLIARLEDRFGAKEEAATFRAEVQRHKAMTDEQQILTGLQRIEGLMEKFEWVRAEREIEMLQGRFPDDNRVRALSGELEDRREKRKRRLLTEFDDAFRRGDVDLAGRLIRQLDGYLSPNEAAALMEPARGVFRAHLHQLGVQFSMAVSEKNWRRALDVGQEIIESYPNSRFAREVRERLDVLRQRAAEADRGPQPAAAPAMAAAPQTQTVGAA